jgi:hypothetical protein
MSALARYIVDAVVMERRSPTELARDHAAALESSPLALGAPRGLLARGARAARRYL